MDRAQPIFSVENIRKTFPGTIALDGVSLSGYQGEILSLVGENGAGKSTLTKILAGAYPTGTFEGTVWVGNSERRFGSVRDAEHAGVVLIPQELAVVPAMSVAENLFLNREPSRCGFVRFDELIRQANRLLSEFGMHLDPTSPMGRLSVAEQQFVEIAKALSKDARVLILDEPTSSLTRQETEILFQHLRDLRADGLCAVYISHRIDEVDEIADRIIVLRDGRIVGEGAPETLSVDEVVRMMVGRELSDRFVRESRPLGRRVTGRVLEIRDWSVPDPHLPGRSKVEGVSFEVAAGEVLGVFGAVGSGRTELLMSLFGAYTVPGHGSMRVDGRPIKPRSPHQALEAGIALLTEDRQRLGIEPWMDVMQNLTLSVLPRVSRWGVMQEEEEKVLAAGQIKALTIGAKSARAPVNTLSGGNQQKVILGRVLLPEPKVLLLDEPTRGIDVGAKADLFTHLDELASRGLGIVFVSSEAPEVLGIADHVMVLREGRRVGFHEASEVSPELLVAEATGGSQ